MVCNGVIDRDYVSSFAVKLGAAEAAGAHAKFGEMHGLLFAHPDPLKGNLLRLAAQLKLKERRFQEKVREDLLEGVKARRPSLSMMLVTTGPSDLQSLLNAVEGSAEEQIGEVILWTSIV